jgi:hypothetical protein
VNGIHHDPLALGCRATYRNSADTVAILQDASATVQYKPNSHFRPLCGRMTNASCRSASCPDEPLSFRYSGRSTTRLTRHEEAVPLLRVGCRQLL